MNYLAEIDGYFYGYNNPCLLRIDRMQARQEGGNFGLILKKTDDKLRTIYKVITPEEMEGEK